MKSLTIIVPNTDFGKLSAFLTDANQILSNYSTTFVFFHSSAKPNDVVEDQTHKFVLVQQNTNYSDQITQGFENLQTDAVIVADMHTKNAKEYLEKLVQAWEQGSKIVRLKYRKSKNSFFDKIAHFFAKIYRTICNGFLSILGLNKDTNCYNTFQLFDREVYVLISHLPEKNSYLRNSQALSNFAETNVFTDEKIKIAKHKMQRDSNLKWSIAMFVLFWLSLAGGIVALCLINSEYTLTIVSFMLFLLVGFGGMGIYAFSNAYLKYKYNK